MGAEKKRRFGGERREKTSKDMEIERNIEIEEEEEEEEEQLGKFF